MLRLLNKQHAVQECIAFIFLWHGINHLHNTFWPLRWVFVYQETTRDKWDITRYIAGKHWIHEYTGRYFLLWPDTCTGFNITGWWRVHIFAVCVIAKCMSIANLQSSFCRFLISPQFSFIMSPGYKVCDLFWLHHSPSHKLYLVPLSGKLQAAFPLTPSAGPPLSVLNTIIEFSYIPWALRASRT